MKHFGTPRCRIRLQTGCLAVICFLLAWHSVLPPFARAISIKEEEELSREFMAILKKRYTLVEDPVIVDYVNGIGKKLLAAMPPQPFGYHFYVVKQHVYNAFATPAGHIFLHSGLIEAMETEGELAGILAHEIAHVAKRHISQKIERAQKIQWGTLAGLVAGAFLGVAGAGAAAQAVTMGSVAAGQSMMLAYSREDEVEADQMGLEILGRSGFDPEGLLTSLKVIRGQQWFGSEQIPTYLSTHPGAEERIVYLANWIESQGRTGRPSKSADPWEFRFVRNRLIALYGDEAVARHRFSNAVKNDPEDLAARYGYGLILARMGNRPEAVQHLKKVLEKRAFDPYILTDLGSVYYLDGKLSEALRTLEGALSLASRYPEALFYLAKAHIDNGNPAKAAELLETLIAARPNYTMAYYSLGETYGRQGKMGEAHYYLGRFYWNRGDAKNAGFHLRRAAGMIQDPDKSRDIKEILEKLRKEERDSPKSQP